MPAKYSESLKEAKKAGAYCRMPPKSPVPASIKEEIVDSSEPAEQILPEGKFVCELPTSSEDSTYTEESLSVAEEVDDQKNDYVIVAWHADDLRGREPIGIARLIGYKHGSRDGARFFESDIITTGIETIHPGVKIRAIYTPPESFISGMGHLTEVEIYRSEPASKKVTKWVKSAREKVLVGKEVECEINNWHDIGGNGRGFAWILPREKRLGSLYISQCDVIVGGKIEIGTRIRCTVALPSNPKFRNLEGHDILVL